MRGEPRRNGRLLSDDSRGRRHQVPTGKSSLSLRGRSPRSEGPEDSRLVALRHHKSLWLAPAALLAGALLPWPYGYYELLRLAVCAVSAWIAYEQWRHDDAVSGWVVAFGGIAMLYNPLLPVHLTREIWSVLNLASAAAFLLHLRALRGLVRYHASPSRDETRSRRLRGLSVANTLRHPQWLVKKQQRRVSGTESAGGPTPKSPKRRSGQQAPGRE